MKSTFGCWTLCILGLLSFNQIRAQDISGEWNGMLSVPGMSIRLVIHISATADGYTSTMDSPDQGATGIKVDTTSFEQGELKLTLLQLGATYEGKVKDTMIMGTFTQRGYGFPLKFTRSKQATVQIKRPQEPHEPFPYRSEEILFMNQAAKIQLAGTLTIPQKAGKYPVVILITGSGPQDRNEEILSHKPFLVISDYLTRQGYAVLRYDDRGVGKSEGDFASSTSADFTTDVNSAISYALSRSDIDSKQIFLLGHSEGGSIAPAVAAKNKKVSGIILMAGPGLRGDKLLLLQKGKIELAMGIDSSEVQHGLKVFEEVYELILNSKDDNALQEQVYHTLASQVDTALAKNLSVQICGNWFRYFIRHDPALDLEKVKVPVLALNGGNDLQVPATENLAAIETALKKGGNKNTTIKRFPHLNHLFQESDSGLPSEYGTIEQTISPEVLQSIVSWLQRITNGL